MCVHHFRNTLRPPTLILSSAGRGSRGGVTGGGSNFRELDHLDLATTPTQQQQSKKQLQVGGEEYVINNY